MSINTSSAELVTHQGLDDSKTAASTDRHHGQLRHEVQTKADGAAQTAFEHNMRETANMEIGRGRNMYRVV